MEEQTLVINDLLSFLTCKLPIYSRTKLIKALRGFYSLEDIEEAHNTLLATLPDRKSTLKAHKFKHKDPLVEIYEKIKLVPENDWPLFVCKDLNNIPSFDSTETHEPSSDEDELDFDFEAEHIKMKEELKKLRSLASDLNEQLNNFLENANTNLSGSDSDMPNEEVEGSATLSQNRFLPDNSVENHSNQMNVNIIENDENFVNHIVKTEKDNSFPDEDEHVIQLSPSNSEVLESTDQLKHPTEEILYIRDKTIDTLERDSFQNDATSIQISSEGNSLKDNLKSMVLKENEKFPFDDSSLYVSNRAAFSETVSKESSEVTINGDVLNCNPQMTDETKYVNVPFSCKKCLFETLDLLDYNSHLLSHYSSSSDLCECSLCLAKFCDLEELKYHVNVHNWRKPFYCHLCPYKSKDDFRMRSHYMKHYENKGPNQYECFICGKVCGTRNSLEKHKQMHKRNYIYKCDFCHLSFPHKGALSQHMTSHTKEKCFICSYCGHGCDSKHALDSHIKVHFKSDDIRCHICNENFYSRVSLKHHILSQHPKDKPFKCEFCKEEFTFKHTYLVHRKIHLRSQLFDCQYCNKKFKSQAYLKVHHALHEGKKPYKCSFCDYESASRTMIKKHESIHGNQILGCNRCDYTTKWAKDLEKHKLSHTSESFVDKLVIIMDD